MDTLKKKQTKPYLVFSKILKMKPWPENTEASAKWILADSLWKWEKNMLD